MQLTVEIPDDLIGPISVTDPDISRRALEALGVEEYKKGHITKAQLRRLLGMETRYGLDGFLKAHDVWIEYSTEDAHRDAGMLKRLGF